MRNLLFLSLSLIFLVGCSKDTVTKIDLSGTWQFAIDSLDEGEANKWYSAPLTETVVLPGSMNTNGKGNPVSLATKWTGQIVDSSFFKSEKYAKYRQPDNFKIPFWLQPLKHYQGAAWYQKEVIIPAEWAGKAIFLNLERCHWESTLWVDGKLCGMQNSLGTAHKYTLSKALTPGKHLLAIRIDNRIKDIDPGYNSHSVSDHTQSNWNGIVGDISLEARAEFYIASVEIIPHIKEKTITANISVVNSSNEHQKALLQLATSGITPTASVNIDVELNPGENSVSVEYAMGNDVKLWDEFNPNVYRLQLALNRDDRSLVDTLSSSFGMREISVDGKHILLNGRRIFLRGTLECAIFPKTGYPPTDVAAWARIFKICRAHGLNHIRFHSWCPPEAAFVAADAAGFYLQVECSSWANQSTTIGDGKPFDKYVYEESELMVKDLGNHPSFCMMAYGNEPAGRNHKAFLSDFVAYWKNKDARRIYTSGAGWPNLPVNDFLSDSEPRIQHWGEGLKSRINASAPTTNFDWTYYIDRFNQPMISHEIGQWCVYPNFKEMPKYDGVLKPRNFEIFQETLAENGMAELADSFLLASGKLQALCYKADIEAALRTPDMGGFQLLDLHDFPGQGTALVGVLDPFWDEKGYVSAEEYSRFCNSIVPLARMEKMIYSSADTFMAAVEVANFGSKTLTACAPSWEIKNVAGEIIASGKLDATDIPVGNGLALGDVNYPLNKLQSAQKLNFSISVADKINDWDFWVYPAVKKPIEKESSILVTQELTPEAVQLLENGGKVLLTLKKGTLNTKMGGSIQIGFSSIFWNTAWTSGQAPFSLGILCNPKHPALADFPTEYHSNWQWWDAISHANAINLTSLPSGLKPIVRIIDDWFTNRPLALVFEAKVGNGKLIVSGIDLLSDLDTRLEAQQMLYSFKNYMVTDEFNPETNLSIVDIKKLVK